MSDQAVTSEARPWRPVRKDGPECDWCGEPLCGTCGVHAKSCKCPHPDDPALEYETRDGVTYARPK
jgi:hypothetical protein